VNVSYVVKQKVLRGQQFQVKFFFFVEFVRALKLKTLNVELVLNI